MSGLYLGLLLQFLALVSGCLASISNESPLIEKYLGIRRVELLRLAMVALFCCGVAVDIDAHRQDQLRQQQEQEQQAYVLQWLEQGFDVTTDWLAVQHSNQAELHRTADRILIESQMVRPMVTDLDWMLRESLEAIGGVFRRQREIARLEGEKEKWEQAWQQYREKIKSIQPQLVALSDREFKLFQRDHEAFRQSYLKAISDCDLAIEEHEVQILATLDRMEAAHSAPTVTSLAYH